MPYIPPPHARVGQRLKAARLNYDEDGIRAAQIVAGDGVLVTRGVSGTSVAADPGTSSFWIRLLAGDGLGRYAWQRIAGGPGTGGSVTWVDVPGVAGTLAINGDAAIEANGVATLQAGTRIEVDREAGSGQIRFQMDICPT